MAYHTAIGGCLAWLAVRFALLGIEIASRPLYPWDKNLRTQWPRVWYGSAVSHRSRATWRQWCARQVAP
jgi:hypothetical protein